ncbi:inositol monophosphatase [Bartonella sp. HY329]|uniref:inositol monophosphatase family protein n=1 Tax=unclassified Bartonella TaxID=2645622 RepID=UPI0021C94526|nr:MULTISPECIES: inositol monophosphatase family protein [unclassified Bartonella]UXM96437.1 inositol monophosphatase [Bartonella sp. HY329]UXN10761.1 inositol monophosphatase [Bartonella sp. HY328]
MAKNSEKLLHERYALALQLAKSAGNLALDYFNNRDQLIIETKQNPQDLVSMADRNVEKHIQDAIYRHFPEDAFLGEESGISDHQSEFLWVIDPIDGTAPFLAGIGDWCVSIAVLYQGKPAIGVIYVPCKSELYRAMIGDGAFLNEKPIGVTEHNTIANGLTGFGCNHHISTERKIDILQNLLAAGSNFYRNASGALMIAYVAAGRLVGYVEPYMHLWDCAAGFCLVQEAGGKIMPFPTDRENLKKGHPVLVAAPHNYDQLKKIASF